MKQYEKFKGVGSSHLTYNCKITFPLMHFLKYFIKQKRQNKKITILLSRSVYLPERFFLRKSGNDSFIKVRSVRNFPKD
jgi:hypothetical protein